MAEFENEDQGGDSDGEGSEERSFGEVVERETTDDGGTEDSTADAGESEETVEKGEEESEEESEEETKPELTEKGTKLDPNPQSAVHQQLANEKRVRSQMEQVLADPKKLAQFMESQYGIKSQISEKKEEAEVPSTKEYTAADFESLDDVAKVVNSLQSSFSEKTRAYEDKIQELNTHVQDLLSGGKAQQLANRTLDEVASLLKEPELTAGSPEFIEGLEQDIADEYRRLDFDESTGMYRGEHSVATIGKSLLAAARRGAKRGSLKAQTVVKDKTAGKVVTSTKVKEGKGTDNLKPGDSIAQGISKLFS